MIGFQEHDAVLALGVAPVAARHRRGVRTDVVSDVGVETAFAVNSVLSLPFVLDEVVPTVEAAIPRRGPRRRPVLTP